MKTLSALLLFVGLAVGQQQTVFKRAAIQSSTATVSAPLPNIGQAVHILTVTFPAAVADVDSFVIRIEASFDNADYFPISEDITSAVYTGSFAYAITRANGSYPFVRINYTTPAAGLTITANYTGSIQPIGQFRLVGSRYIAASPLEPTLQTGICTVIANNCYIDGQRVVPLIPSEWTSINLTTDSRTDGDGYITYYRPTGNSNGYALFCKSLPGSQFDIVLTMDRDPQIYGSDSQSPAAFILRESSTGKFVAYVFQGGNSGHVFAREYWNSPTSFGGGTNPATVTPMRLIQFRITQGATTRSYSVPNRGSTKWSQLSAFGQADPNATGFTTGPDQVCFGAQGVNGNYATFVSFVGYEVLP